MYLHHEKPIPKVTFNPKRNLVSSLFFIIAVAGRLSILKETRNHHGEKPTGVSRPKAVPGLKDKDALRLQKVQTKCGCEKRRR